MPRGNMLPAIRVELDDERSGAMAKEYTITLHEPPVTQIIRNGMERHMNEVAQEGWKLITIIKESGYYYLYWERD